MRARYIFLILLIPIALVAFGPALLAIGSEEIAEAFGCEVSINRVIPCEIGGKETFYDLGFSIWYPTYRSPPPACCSRRGLLPRSSPSSSISASVRLNNQC